MNLAPTFIIEPIFSAITNCVPIASIVTTCPFTCILSNRSGMAVISLLFFPIAFWPRQNPSSLLHADTICNGLSSLRLFSRMVFPSIQVIFFSNSPSFRSRHSCHFTYIQLVLYSLSATGQVIENGGCPSRRCPRADSRYSLSASYQNGITNRDSPQSSGFQRFDQ